MVFDINEIAVFYGIEQMETPGFVINTDDVVDEVIDNEAILINLQTGSYYSLEGSACVIWKWLKSGALSVSDCSRLAAEQFDGNTGGAPNEIGQFLDELLGEGLLVIANHIQESASERCVSEDRMHYVTPKLAKYTDMEAMLLLDPIHDVTGNGWPEQR